MNGAGAVAAPFGVRLDKFLWACRFYKTRGLASDAIAAGHVEVNGRPAKPAREIHIGDEIELRLPQGALSVIVRALSDRRGPAPVAAALYEETAASCARREQERLMRQMEPAAGREAGRPTKRDRRLIHRFTGKD